MYERQRIACQVIVGTAREFFGERTDLLPPFEGGFTEATYAEFALELYCRLARAGVGWVAPPGLKGEYDDGHRRNHKPGISASGAGTGGQNDPDG